ncbi:ferrochelatase [Orbus sturtevantii]|uniref:ferrochelatase n=1 Tax=Orbus sturtevantii TaxID=3074109 RepID=UPI00370D1D50
MTNKQGILIVNLGTPSQATPDAIKKYLGEFLRDRHVVDISPFVWLPILYGIVIPKRLKYITKHYQKIWLNEQSPLLYYSKQLCHKLQESRPNLQCELAMNYGEPTLESALNRLKHCDTINVISMYPQYSTTTTLAVINKIKSLTKQWSDSPKISYLHDYADHPVYIAALVQQIDEHICIDQPDVLMLSYHGIPISYIKKRQDEYVIRCELTTQLIQQALHLYYPKLEIIMTYQSRFGKGKWTEPNTSDILIELAKKEKSVTVICPGFAVDCIETLHEIDIENRELFMQYGGEQFNYIPALNDSTLQVGLLYTLLDDVLRKPTT